MSRGGGLWVGKGGVMVGKGEGYGCEKGES